MDELQPNTPQAAPGIPKIARPKLSFASQVNRLELEEGTWVEYRLLPYEEYVQFISDAEAHQKAGDMTSLAKANLTLLQKCLTGWSDTTVPCTPENIANLGTDVIIFIGGEIMSKLAPEKKS